MGKTNKNLVVNGASLRLAYGVCVANSRLVYKFPIRTCSPLNNATPKIPCSSAARRFIYDLVLDKPANKFKLQKVKTKYTNFKSALDKITRPSPGEIIEFIGVLQEKLDEKLENNPLENHTLADILNV